MGALNDTFWGKFMYITLKMKIQDQEFTLDVNLANRAGRIYRQQYGRDLLKDMAEIYRKLHKSPFSGINVGDIDLTGKTEKEIYEQLISRVDISKFIEQNSVSLDFEETETGGKIIWAFAKNRNDSIPNYEDWIDSFDFVLPVGDIVSALYEAWGKSAQPTVEIKN